MWEKILAKGMSGRYFLTVICGLVFAFATAKNLLPAEAVVAIISMVFVSYFQRQDRKNGGA